MDDEVSDVDRIETLRCLLAAPRLDADTAAVVLSFLPVRLQHDLAEQIRRARTAIGATQNGDGRHEAVARYALAIVLVALERSISDAV